MQHFDTEAFIQNQIEKIKGEIRDERALIAVSGGVDSVTSAVLTFKAIGSNLLCVMLDDAFMREGEPQRITQLVSQPPIRLPIQVLEVQDRFLSALEGLEDAEEKRKAFRDTFYKVLGETAKKEKCKVLVQGTIKADILETTEGIKTQHNVLEQMGISSVERYGFKIVEPLTSLFKGQVRKVARKLGVPEEISERQPFPGPGLSLRVIGEINGDKLDSIKRATTILEKHFEKHNPSQCFAAIVDNKTISYSMNTHIQESLARLLNIPLRCVEVRIFGSKATGVKSGRRKYGHIAALKAQTMEGDPYRPSIPRLVDLQKRALTVDPTLTRILYTIAETPTKLPYVIIMRAIQTQDFLTAEVVEIPWNTMDATAEEILKECPRVSAVYYDVTPKPPATIEME